MDDERVVGALHLLDDEGHSYRNVANHYRGSVSALYDAVASNVRLAWQLRESP